MYEKILEVIIHNLIDYAFYIILAFMFGVYKAIETIEERELSFSIKNLVRFTFMYAVAAPFKIGLDINFKSKKNKIFGRK